MELIKLLFVHLVYNRVQSSSIIHTLFKSLYEEIMMPNSVEPQVATAFVGEVRVLEVQDGPTYFIQRANNGEVYYQEGETFDAFGPRNLICNYTVSEEDITWLDDASIGVQDMPQAFQNAFLNILSPRPVPRPASAASENPRPPQAESKPVYDSAVIAALEDMMRVLERLAQHEDAFKIIQKDMLDAVRQENMPISVISPVESPAAATPPSTPTPDAPLSPQEHLAILKELKIKINHLNSYDHKIPASVKKVLHQLEAHVDLSIQVVEQNIAKTQAERKDLKNKFTSKRGDFMPARHEYDIKLQNQEQEQEHTQNFTPFR
jgi:hypothetical protein